VRTIGWPAVDDRLLVTAQLGLHRNLCIIACDMGVSRGVEGRYEGGDCAIGTRRVHVPATLPRVRLAPALYSRALSRSPPPPLTPPGFVCVWSGPCLSPTDDENP
jgi:hypothetical protein